MNHNWPALDYNSYKETVQLVHLWTQIIGKVRLRKMPWLNHSWHVSLYVSPRGFTTGSIPYENGLFEIEFDFLNHLLHFRTSAASGGKIALESQTVAAFYQSTFEQLEQLGIPVSIHPAPNEMEPAIPFAEDHRPQTYDPVQMLNLWQAFVSVHKVFLKFRAGFIGKCSPVHLFWGAFDLAVTRFSGKEAPQHPGGMPNMPLKVMQEAYSHEVSSAGFWPGGPMHEEAIFYAYAYPAPDGFAKAVVRPAQASFLETMGEFILPYEVVRTAPDPDAMLLDFLQSTYDAAAELGAWDQEAFELGDPRVRFS